MRRLPLAAIFFLVTAALGRAVPAHAQSSSLELEFRMEKVQEEIKRQEKTVAELRARFQELHRHRQELQAFIRDENRKIELLEQQKSKAAVKPAEKKTRPQVTQEKMKTEESSRQARFAEQKKEQERRAQEQAVKHQQLLEAQKQKESGQQAKKFQEQSGQRAQEKQEQFAKDRQRQMQREIEAAQQARCKNFGAALAKLQKRKDTLSKEAQRLENAIRSEEAKIKVLEQAIKDLSEKQKKLAG